MNSILLVSAIIIIIGILCSQLSHRFGIPALFLFIILGMIFGSDGLFKIQFADFQFAEMICSVALIFIIFYGGFTTHWNYAKKVAPLSLVLSSLGVILTALFTGLFCYYILHFEWLESMLIGSVLSSTDAASVFSVLRSKQLNLKYKSASILELESGSNDPWAYTLTIIFLSLMTHSMSYQSIIQIIFSQIFFGILFGAMISYLAIKIIDYFGLKISQYMTIIMVAIALLSYALPSLLNGNGYMSAYIVGIVLGNYHIPDKKKLVHFFDDVVELFQMFIFFLLGLLSFPSQLFNLIVPALSIALFLTFIARPLVIFAIMKVRKRPLHQIALISFAGLRGATSIVFAIMVSVSMAYTKNDIFHIVFFIVLFSLGIQGTLLPYVSKKLNMIDETENVLKTFTDYSEENDIQFMTITIDDHHPWIHQYIKDITLPPQMKIVMIKRNDQTVIPHGNQAIESGDSLIISAFESQTDDHLTLTEIIIDQDHEWCQKYIRDITIPFALIVFIQRDQTTIIPQGNVQLLENDIIVLAHSK